MEILATGVARKMRTRLTAPVSYEMPLGEHSVSMNELIGGKVRLRYQGRIFCVHCGRASNKSFSQGYCYPCFQSLAQCDSCIIHPERCHFDQGTCREPAWGEAFCMQDHIVYLANSSGLKVGITRATQIPTRWIDQGAIEALAIARVRSRLQSGVLEVMFKKFVNDKTNWRDMLREGDYPVDLMYERDTLLENAAEDLKEMTSHYGFHALSLIKGIDPVTIKYPVQGYPEKISSFNFDKDPVVEGTLLGIKGQYLMFDTGVINIRRFGGYELELARD